MPTFCDVTEADLDALRRSFGAGEGRAPVPLRARTRGPRRAPHAAPTRRRRVAQADGTPAHLRPTDAKLTRPAARPVM